MPFFHPAGSHLLVDSKKEDWFTRRAGGSPLCAYACALVKRRGGPNKAEIDALSGRESSLIVADIQLQKILPPNVEKVKVESGGEMGNSKRVGARN